MSTFLSRRSFLKAGLSLATLAPAGAAAAPAGAARGPYGDAVLVKGAPPLPQAGAFTMVVLPDTQNYSRSFPATFEAQTRWVVEQREARNITCVLHLGDITENNNAGQWENALKAMKHLDGHVPYFMAPGNHDYGANGGAADRSSLFSRYFPAAAMKQQPTWGGFYDREPDRVDNSYHLFSAAGRNFIVLCLEFGPRRDVLRWANEVTAKHSDREAILVTHAYLYDDDTRHDWKKPGVRQAWNPHAYGLATASGHDVTDGEELWQLLVSRHENFIMTLNGHILHDGLGRLSTPTPGGREVTQMLVNFQMRPNGGDGWLRLLEMRPDRSMQVCDYSPLREERNESPQNRFNVQLTTVGKR